MSALCGKRLAIKTLFRKEEMLLVSILCTVVGLIISYCRFGVKNVYTAFILFNFNFQTDFAYTIEILSLIGSKARQPPE